VLVAGGTYGENSLFSAELYDPLTGNWTFTGSMIYSRYEHTASVLQNESVLVAGGFGMGGPLFSAEFYSTLQLSYIYF
jgi:hypothetical protein